MKASKYRNQRVVTNNIRFDSKAEAERYRELILLQEAGAISGLKIHPRYVLQEGYNKRDGTHVRPIFYESDFEYVENGVLITEDVKGVKTPVFLLKQKLFERAYPHIEMRIREA